MAAAGIGNPVGAVWAQDFGAPKVLTFKAKANISGGVFVQASGVTGVVSSGLNSFTASDLQVAGDASGGQFTGIALQSVASGGNIPVAVEGVFLLQANGTVTAGVVQGCDGNNAISDCGSVAGNVSHQRIIGRALTTAASGTYALCYMRG